MKKILSVLMCAVAAAVLSCAAFAAESTPQYQEAVLELAQSGHGDTRLTDFTAGPNGYLNYFIVETPDSNFITPTQYQSRDYGKTWKQIDMSWYADMEKRFPGFGRAQTFHVADNGDIYFTATTGEKKEEVNVNGKNVVVYPYVYGIFKYTGGKIVQIPNVTIGSYYAAARRIVHVYENGDILVYQINHAKAKEENTGFTLYSADGKRKKEVSTDDYGIPMLYSNDGLYCIYHGDNGPENVSICDVRTGKRTVIPFSKEMTTNWVNSIGVSKNGTIYVALTSGLYQCQPGKTSFTKLIGGQRYHFSKNATSSTVMACADDGTVYLQGLYLNEADMNDPNNEKLGKLYRYSPVK